MQYILDFTRKMGYKKKLIVDRQICSKTLVKRNIYNVEKYRSSSDTFTYRRLAIIIETTPCMLQHDRFYVIRLMNLLKKLFMYFTIIIIEKSYSYTLSNEK